MEHHIASHVHINLLAMSLWNSMTYWWFKSSPIHFHGQCQKSGSFWPFNHQWIGFLGKILTGNHRFSMIFPLNMGLKPVNFPLIQSIETRDIRQHCSRTTWAPGPRSIFCAIHRKCPANSASSLPFGVRKTSERTTELQKILWSWFNMLQYGSIWFNSIAHPKWISHQWEKHVDPSVTFKQTQTDGSFLTDMPMETLK